MHIYGDHLLHCERGTHGIRRHDAQVRLLQADLKKAVGHTVLEPRPLGRHNERPDLCALGSHRVSDMLDITVGGPSGHAEDNQDRDVDQPARN